MPEFLLPFRDGNGNCIVLRESEAARARAMQQRTGLPFTACAAHELWLRLAYEHCYQTKPNTKPEQD